MSDDSMQNKQSTSFLHAGQAAYLEQLYEDYLIDPSRIPEHWVNYFNGLSSSGHYEPDVSHAAIQSAVQASALQSVKASSISVSSNQPVEQLIQAYRMLGHLASQTNPLHKTGSTAELSAKHYGLSESDSMSVEWAGQTFATIKDLSQKLAQTYCGAIGYEFMHVQNEAERHWLQHAVEQAQGKYNYSHEERTHLLEMLVRAEGLEKYLATKYVGQKRFSLEGCDSFVPLMDRLVQKASDHEFQSVIVGMAHRGRLNMLVNVCGQAPRALFDEFEGKRTIGLTSGDVKYHNGFSADVATQKGSIHLSLAFNPSHLEFINAVVMGSSRARGDLLNERSRTAVLPILVHGDASFAGQGIVMETLNMSQTSAYGVGGTVHVVINNQIGFTTNQTSDARSSRYCTDIAKMIDAPIIHVNAEDLEAVAFCADLAIRYRHQFKKDIVIDLIGYRKHGHNEADEPAATQPLMYEAIRQRQTVCQQYQAQLIADEILSEDDVSAMHARYKAALDHGEPVVEMLPGRVSEKREKIWKQYLNHSWEAKGATKVSRKKLEQLGQVITSLPEQFTLQRQVGNMMKARKAMVDGEQSFDWGCAETLAYASLLDEGYFVRISGQDAQRGTFSHRFAMLHDNKTGEVFTPLSHVHCPKENARFEVYNSLLSEQGVLGFEYGYASVRPGGLTIWEAQFGDFANGAQVIIDQFISSGWQKWNRLSGLTMLLPHGYEGMGPEHSSARLERFMQLCAQDNIQVCVPSSPSQIFHLLRRQAVRPYRKPLVIMSPKSLLRNKLAVSDYASLTQGHFECAIPEIDDVDPKHVKRVVICSGKVYYELLTARREAKLDKVAIIRLEQLYPFPEKVLTQVLKPYAKVKDIVWCQEEPKNQGAWYCIRHNLESVLQKGQSLHYAGREAAAAPAAGYPKLHKKQQDALIKDALKLA